MKTKAKKDSLKRIHSDMEFIVGHLARPDMRECRVGVSGRGRMLKPKYAHPQDRHYLVVRTLIVECRNIMRRLRKLKARRPK